MNLLIIHSSEFSSFLPRKSPPPVRLQYINSLFLMWFFLVSFDLEQITHRLSRAG
ncbi:hypothetical protein C3B79_3728 [Aeromonas hydrophila]|nr:hypothetical protein C3B79_3728 [Aeromonas hydrophila]